MGSSVDDGMGPTRARRRVNGERQVGIGKTARACMIRTIRLYTFLVLGLNGQDRYQSLRFSALVYRGAFRPKLGHFGHVE